jgi:hypothetical protein
MKKTTHGFFLATLLLALTGCGGSDGSSAAPAPVIPYTQQNLPDDGYWMCRLDYPIVVGNFAVPGHAVVAGQSLAIVKSKMGDACFRMPEANAQSCRNALQAQQFRCARAESSGGLVGYPGPTTCQMSYQYPVGDRGMRSGAFASFGPNQAVAARGLFNQCRRSMLVNDCSEALLSNAMVCRPSNF